jgi:heat shock protein HslJ
MKLFTLITVFAVALTACSGGASSQDNLEGPWEVSALTDENGELEPPLDGSFLTAIIAEAVIEGFSGCNSYNGGANLNGSEVSFGPFASTLKACPLPDGLMEQEGNYLSLLQTADTWETTDSGVDLVSEGETVIQLVEISTDVDGTSWNVIAINNQSGGVQSVVADSDPTLVFDEESGVTGNTGCNDFFGEYTTDGDTIEFSKLAMTEKFCEATADQETWMIAALEGAVTFTTDGRTLDLFDSTGSRLLQATKT